MQRNKGWPERSSRRSEGGGEGGDWPSLLVMVNRERRVFQKFSARVC